MEKLEIITALREIMALPEGPKRQAKFHALCQTGAPRIIQEIFGATTIALFTTEEI